MFVAFLVLYRVVPNRHVTFGEVWPGAFVAATCCGRCCGWASPTTRPRSPTTTPRSGRSRRRSSRCSSSSTSPAWCVLLGAEVARANLLEAGRATVPPGALQCCRGRRFGRGSARRRCRRQSVGDLAVVRLSSPRHSAAGSDVERCIRYDGVVHSARHAATCPASMAMGTQWAAGHIRFPNTADEATIPTGRHAGGPADGRRNDRRRRSARPGPGRGSHPQAQAERASHPGRARGSARAPGPAARHVRQLSDQLDLAEAELADITAEYERVVSLLSQVRREVK